MPTSLESSKTSDGKKILQKLYQVECSTWAEESRLANNRDMFYKCSAFYFAAYNDYHHQIRIANLSVKSPYLSQLPGLMK